MARDLLDYNSDTFIRDAKRTLEAQGFVSNNHTFTPFGNTMNIHKAEIKDSLTKAGFKGGIEAAEVRNPDGALTYFIYSTRTFDSKKKAINAVKAWLKKNMMRA